MPLFYKGVPANTFHSQVDFRLNGLAPRAPGGGRGIDEMIRHICDGTVVSAFISLTHSYTVAEEYAYSERSAPSRLHPGLVYEVQIDDPPPLGVEVIDPVARIAGANHNLPCRRAPIITTAGRTCCSGLPTRRRWVTFFVSRSRTRPCLAGHREGHSYRGSWRQSFVPFETPRSLWQAICLPEASSLGMRSFRRESAGPMVQIIPLDLSDAGIHLGALRLTRAEWWEEAPRFVLLRFEDGLGFRPYGIRMDMDKKTFLDSLDDPPLDSQLHAQKDEIWRLIAERLPKVVQSSSFAFI